MNLATGVFEARQDAFWAFSFLHPTGRIDAGQFEKIWSALIHAWSEPQRAYHRLDHLLSCLVEWRSIRHDEADDARLVLALCFHDAIYDPTAKDNEERSADWALAAGRQLGLTAEDLTAVAQMILATKAHAVAPDEATRRLLDIDLSVLGASPERFAAYDAGIREEYRHVPETVYRRVRAQVLQSFLDRRPLYLTSEFRERYESPARANLRAAIDRLRS
ncbi:metal-dependent hydrolase [Phenylobacterium sp.]|uniref:HD domain-containing protein n=1 Tax=Phenylobacterium sp. TaxID=1871053 RepID=UPI002737AB8A|nr:metal-dependent hydrolase [Phenylobacterium sp.]MDP3870865.1 metal-dependent hydrolase [Phenylobacterium sp.]